MTKLWMTAAIFTVAMALPAGAQMDDVYRRMNEDLIRPDKTPADGYRPQVPSPVPPIPIPKPPIQSPPPEPAPSYPEGSVSWAGYSFTGTGREVLLYVENDESFHLVTGTPPKVMPLGNVRGYGMPKVTRSQIHVSTWDQSGGLASVAIWSDTQNQFLHGTINPAGFQMVLTPTGNAKFFQVGDGPMLFRHSATISTQQKTGGLSNEPAWPARHTRRDHVRPCGDAETDLSLYPDGTVRGTMSLSSHCWLNGLHASMVAVFTDANGAPVFSTPPLRLGVSGTIAGGSSRAVVSLNTPRYGIRVPSELMADVRGVAIMHAHDPNDIWRILRDAIAVIATIAAFFT